MINITIDCATGAEAREQLMALLGATDGPFEVIGIEGKKPAAKDFSEPTMEIVKEIIATEAPGSTKKRRTKAEIEAEKNQSPATPGEEGTDIQSDNDAANTIIQDNKDQSAVTAKMLQEKAVELIRLGKKELVVAILTKFGAQSIATADKQPLKVDDYAVVMDELNKL